MSCILLLLSSVTLFAQGTPDVLPLDGSSVKGSLSFNEYHNYYFRSATSGDVTITTTVTGGSAIGVWTWVGTNYIPVCANGIF